MRPAPQIWCRKNLRRKLAGRKLSELRTLRERNRRAEIGTQSRCPTFSKARHPELHVARLAGTRHQVLQQSSAFASFDFLPILVCRPALEFPQVNGRASSYIKQIQRRAARGPATGWRETVVNLRKRLNCGSPTGLRQTHRNVGVVEEEAEAFVESSQLDQCLAPDRHVRSDAFQRGLLRNDRHGAGSFIASQIVGLCSGIDDLTFGLETDAVAPANETIDRIYRCFR